MAETQTERVDLQTLGEGRYLKAYLRYKAGLRDHSPSYHHYSLTAERAEAIRDEGKRIIASLREFAHA